MHQATPRRRPARPLAEAPLDALLARAPELAKGWLLAMVEELPLQEAPRIAAADLAADGPVLCEAMIRALVDDAYLRRFEEGGEDERLAGRAGKFAGAATPEAVSRAVDWLRGVIWSELRENVSDPSADQLFDLADRLALVSELVRGAALRPWSGARSMSVSRGSEEAAPAWEERLADAVGKAKEAGSGLALLLVELEDADRLIAVSTPEQAAVVLDAFEAAIRSGAGARTEVLVAAGRAWVIAPRLDRGAAWRLASRLAKAVSSAEPWRGAPLKASVGAAVLGDDAADAESLLAAAEEARFAAQASGLEPMG
jgi:GGDEF domain-containing protein